MKRTAAYLSIAIYALSPSAHSQCVAAAEIRAQVFVFACQAKTFYAPASAFEYLRKAGIEPPPTAGRVAGTLLTVEVLSSVPADETTLNVATWRKGEEKILFVARPPFDVCPASATMTVVTDTPCCDTGPVGVCIVPREVTVVAVETLL